MEKNKFYQQTSHEVSDVVFGTSSDAIEQGLHQGLFSENADITSNPDTDDKNQIVNEQEQNEIVNPSEEAFNQGLSPEATNQDTTLTDGKKEETMDTGSVIPDSEEKEPVTKSGTDQVTE